MKKKSTPKPVERKCGREICGIKFFPKRHTEEVRVYCSAGCRRLAWNEKKDSKISDALKTCESLVERLRGENRSSSAYREACSIRRVLVNLAPAMQTPALSPHPAKELRP